MIPFNKSPKTGNEIKYIEKAIFSGKLSGNNNYSKLCEHWFEDTFSAKKTLLTPSCTAALEMAAILVDIQPGDEVIAPSYTFVSTVNAFVLRGAKIKFVDIRPDTLNIDESKIENAITNKTKAIVVVHYAGVSCEMDAIMDIAHKNKIYVVEDAAQGVMSTYKGKALGTIGHFGCFSFHETKNYSSGGEGGALIINDDKFIERAEIIREKGTDRSMFFQGLVDKYTWRDIGSSYLPSELQAAYLFAQLEQASEINNKRLSIWEQYYEKLSGYKNLKLPSIPEELHHNAHMFYLIFSSKNKRDEYISFMRANEVVCPFHYVPLHSSPAGKKFGVFVGKEEHTTFLSERLVRLPLFYNMAEDQVKIVLDLTIQFLDKHCT
ncbi:MAG: dTDP-4-amino-4,6-dideoxygalactose transaminase [Francisellaceae bacterium]|jgi:dTDP-4-amino-4,6-dideoxygalactose transaminase